ncbi:MAG: 50S ribosomal protein L21 [Planctomycetota bacterium]
MYAVIEDSGRQFKIAEGDVLEIDRVLPGEEGDSNLPETVTFDHVLFVGGGDSPTIGTPVVEGATVTADVLGPVKGKKLRVVKVKRRKGVHIETGHRQKYLRVKVTGIKA